MLAIPAKYRRYVWFGIGALVLYIIFRIWASIPAYDSKKMGEFTSAKVAYAKLSKELLKKNDLLTVSIAAKDKLLADKTTMIGHKTEIVGQLTKKQAELEAQFKLIKDCPGQVINLSSQIVTLKDTIVTKYGIISDFGDKVVLLTAQKGDALAGWDNEKRLRLACDDQSAACDAVQKQLARDLKICRLTGKLKTGMVIAAAGYILYNALKK